MFFRHWDHRGVEHGRRLDVTRTNFIFKTLIHAFLAVDAQNKSLIHTRRPSTRIRLALALALQDAASRRAAQKLRSALAQCQVTIQGLDFQRQLV